MWLLGTWFSGRLGSATLMAGLDLKGLDQPKRFYDSKKGGITLPSFVSFPLLPSLRYTSLAAELISIFLMYLVSLSLHPPPAHLTDVHFP